MVFAVTFSRHEMEKLMGIYGIFIAYGVFCVIGAVFVSFVVPETKNKSLTEIQSELEGSTLATIAI